MAIGSGAQRGNSHVAKSFHIVYNVFIKKTVRLDVWNAAVIITETEFHVPHRLTADNL
jgi:hypothetical protein